MKQYLYIISILFLTGFFSVHAQQVSLEGRVLDSVQQPLVNTNILAIPLDKEQSIAFSITNENGNYKLNLQKNLPYSIEISYLGYNKISDTLTLQQNSTKNYILQASNESLDEILIRYKYQPVTVKKDTITYRTEVFTTGEERKLREVLKKLPGVEVDRAGNVTVNGKKVDKLLVENKEFFTGDTKLGVNNIPADAVEEVEVLDNYSEIPFLKNLQDSDKMVMNIKLKEGKKKFVFGDIEAGGGVEDRYVVHPTLFYYSPKTSINLIGDANNTGKKSFTFREYLNFEGGMSKLISDPAGYFNLSNSDFAQSLQNQDFVFNRNLFGAFNIAQQLSPKTRVNAYTIANDSRLETQQNQRNTFLANNTITNIEDRNISNTANNFFSLNKINLNYTPRAEADLTANIVLKTSQGDALQSLTTTSLGEDTTGFVSTNSATQSLELLQNVAFNKQFSSKHTSTVQADFNVRNNNNTSLWQFTQPVFNPAIPVTGEAPFDLNQRIDFEAYDASVQLKHYWVLHNFHHVYPIAGYSFSQQKFSSVDAQINVVNPPDFGSNGFINDTSFSLNDAFVGFEYKTKINDVTIKPGVVYHYYYWDVSQFDTSVKAVSKSQVLPQLLVKWDLKSNEKINLKYNLRSRFNDASFYANRLRLSGFNNVYRGNEDLENQLYHQASLTYYRFRLLKGLFYNGGITYTNRLQSIRNQTQVEGINQINTAIYTDLPEEDVNINGGVSKKIKRVTFSLSGNIGIANYSRNINDLVVDYTSNNVSYTAKTETSFKKYPNVELGFTQQFNAFEGGSIENEFTTITPYTVLEYDFLDGFIFKGDYRFNRFVNRAENTVNDFQVANTSLFYNKEDSPWGFEFAVDNIFNIQFKNESSFNEFIVTDIQTFLQPRTAVFKVSYKL